MKNKIDKNLARTKRTEDFLTDHGSDLSKEQIINLQNKLSKLEHAILKKKSKVKKIKTITISFETHSEIKKHCAKNSINIGEWVESVLLEEINSKNE